MSISTIIQRLEITFWMAWVAALRSIRVVRWAPVVLVISACGLALLITAGSAVYLNGGLFGGQPARAEAMTVTNTGTPLQSNTLFILVDDMDSPQAKLEGVWLIVADPAYQHLTFLPLHPRSASAAGDMRDLAQAYRQPGDGTLDPAFAEAVTSYGVWWDHFLVLDRTTLSALVELVGGVGLGNGLADGTLAIASLPEPGNQPEAVLERQALLLMGICQQSDVLFKGADPKIITGLLAGSSRSDLAANEFQTAWEALQQAGSPTCEFPTILGR